MPNAVMQLILAKKSLKSIISYSQVNNTKLPLFEKLEELRDRTVYDYLTKHKKICGLELSDLIENQLIDFNEVDEDGTNLIQHLLAADDLPHFQQLLLAGEKPYHELYEQSEGTQIGDFLRYKPGRLRATVYEHATKRQVNSTQLADLIDDFDDTTSSESSEGELSDTEELSIEEQKAYNKLRSRLIRTYNTTGEGGNSLVLAAARGVHFVPNYFTKAARDDAYTTRQQAHTTYSFSTLIDAGYEAGDEPDEDDQAIVVIDQRNRQFVATLKEADDKKEKTTCGRKPPATRNERKFENLFWREIQAYINSYSTLFNFKGIQTNFGFASLLNPHVSITWKTEVAGMYGSGVRFGWKRGERRDPHYRRYDGKPKHPNLGYIDVFEFPLDYIRNEGVDRLLAYNDGKIDLSNIHLAEAEVIFHSMVEKQYHVRRYPIVLPSFTKVTSQARAEKEHFGMKTVGAYTGARNGLFACIDGQKKGEAYQKWVTLRSQHAVEAQALRIDKATDARLFRQGKVRVYDHGDAVGAELPGPTR